MKRVVFIGTHGQKNLGDELLLLTFMRQLSDPDLHFVVNTYTPVETKQFLAGCNVSVLDTRKQPYVLAWHILRSHAVVFGGGSILKELYTAYGANRYRTLTLIDVITNFAYQLYKPVYFANVGAGPLASTRSLKITRRIVHRAAGISLRDSLSHSIVSRLDGATAQLSVDAAFANTPRALLPATHKHQEAHGSLKVGVNLCRNIRNNENWTYFLDTLCGVLGRVAEQHTIELHGIPMQHGYDIHNNDDKQQLDALKRKLSKHYPEIRFNIHAPKTIEDVAADIADMDVLVAERLHALIMATILEVPFVALQYDIKVSALLCDTGLEQYGVDINTRFKTEELEDILIDVIQDRSAIQMQLHTIHKAKRAVAQEQLAALKQKLLDA